MSGETDAGVTREIEDILARLRGADPEFEASLTPIFARPSYEVAANHDLPRALRERKRPRARRPTRMPMVLWE